MKKKFILSVLLFASAFTGAFCENFRFKGDVKTAFPVFFSERQTNTFKPNPIFELKFDIPVYNNFGIVISGDFAFSDMIAGGTWYEKIGDSRFYSVFTGAYYCFEFQNGFSIIPDIQIGYTCADINLKSFGNNLMHLFSVQTSVEFEQKINENFGLFAITSLGYYDIYCPFSIGVGAAYIF